MVGKLSPGQNGKVFVQAFFRKLAGRGVPVAHELAPVSSPDSVGASCLPLANRTRAGRREAACRWHANERRSHLPIRSVLPVCHWQTAPEPAGETAGAAPPFMQRCARRSAPCEAEKDRAGQKQRSDFLAAPFHKAPPGRQKSERKFCLFGGGFSAPGAPLRLPGLAAFTRAVAWLSRPGVPAFFLQALHVRVWQRQLFARFSAGIPFPPACVQFAASLLWLPVCPARTIPLLPGRPPV